MKIIAAGDFLGQVEIPRDKGFYSVKEYISDSDVAFVNLETTVFKEGTKGISGGQFSGGSYTHADPSILDDVKAYGFNTLSYANNHTFDFGFNGFLETYKNVKASSIVNAGCGLDLEEASKPAYLETKSGRVAIIGINSSITWNSESVIAGKSSKCFEGRPGVNPLRVDEKIQLTQEQFRLLKEGIEQSNSNADLNILRSEGYASAGKDDELSVMDKITFCKGTEAKLINHPNQKDLSRIINSIKEAKKNADIVLVSIHAHANSGHSKEEVKEYLIEASHSFIDEGADAVLGHGPHILRAVEIYKDRPIFYSLGDFVLQHELVKTAPAELYEKNGLPVDSGLEEVFLKRSANKTRGLSYNPKANEAVIASFEIVDRKLKKIEFMPIELGMGIAERKGCPAPCFTKNIIERLAIMSEEFGTVIRTDKNGFGYVELK